MLYRPAFSLPDFAVNTMCIEIRVKVKVKVKAFCFTSKSKRVRMLHFTLMPGHEYPTPSHRRKGKGICLVLEITREQMPSPAEAVP